MTQLYHIPDLCTYIYIYIIHICIFTYILSHTHSHTHLLTQTHCSCLCSTRVFAMLLHSYISFDTMLHTSSFWHTHTYFVAIASCDALLSFIRFLHSTIRDTHVQHTHTQTHTHAFTYIYRYTIVYRVVGGYIYIIYHMAAFRDLCDPELLCAGNMSRLYIGYDFIWTIKSNNLFIFN